MKFNYFLSHGCDNKTKKINKAKKKKKKAFDFGEILLRI